MEGPRAAFTQTHTHTHIPILDSEYFLFPLFAMMEVGVASPLKILQMSSVRERWQPGGP